MCVIFQTLGMTILAVGQPWLQGGCVLQLMGSCAQRIMLGAESRQEEVKGSKPWEGKYVSGLGFENPLGLPGLALLKSELVGTLGAIPLFTLPKQSWDWLKPMWFHCLGGFWGQL